MEITQELYENEYAQFWIRNNILFFEYKPNVVIDLAVAQRIVADRIQMQNEKAYPILCIIRGVLNSDKAGRDYLAQTGVTENCIERRKISIKNGSRHIFYSNSLYKKHSSRLF
jgi:hypothetical protein